MNRLPREVIERFERRDKASESSVQGMLGSQVKVGNSWDAYASPNLSGATVIAPFKITLVAVPH